MANKFVHCVVGVASGAIAGTASAGEQSIEQRIWEVLGGCIGGYVGARLPDLLDPPNRPDHRHIAHGIANVTAVGLLIWESAANCQVWLRTKADEFASLRVQEQNEFLKLLYQIIEWFLRAVAGAIVGLMSGYASHLALDSMTSSGLPLIARGF